MNVNQVLTDATPGWEQSALEPQGRKVVLPLQSVANKLQNRAPAMPALSVPPALPLMGQG